jgi:hypothetical protein
MRRTWPITIILTLAAGLSALAGTGHAGQVAACDPADPQICMYVPEQVYDVGEVRDVELTDTDRGGYPVPLVVHYPLLDTPEERPVVIWHHGGAPSRRGADRSEDWGEALAAAGYVVVHPSRAPIGDPAPFQVECTANGFADPEECAHWQANTRLGPQTTHFLIDHMDEVEALDPALAGLIDGDRVVVGGHSAGSTAPLANAGAWQQWDGAGTRFDERDERPMAFLASAPQGPMYAGFPTGFQADSYIGIDRPFLFITGVGDETGEPSEARSAGWLTSIGDGDKLLSWDTEPEAVHETMNIDKCDTVVRADHCEWIASIGVAFLDAAVAHRAEARDWLRSGAVDVLTGGAIELHRR